MIAASEAQEYTPYGRQQVAVHPGAVQLGVQEQNNHLESALSSRLSEVVITDAGRENEAWLLKENKTESTDCEEELYYKGKTVVWSIGPGSTETNTNRLLKCCFTGEANLSQVLWCDMHLSCPSIPASFVSSPSLKHSLKSCNTQVPNHPGEDLRNIITILDDDYIHFHTVTGKEYSTKLQFEVSKVWPHKYGILIERKIAPKESVSELKGQTAAKAQSAFDLQRQSVENSMFQRSHGKDLLTFDKSLTGNSTQYFNIPSLHYQSADSSPSSSVTSFGGSTDLPRVFSLTHPLDDFCPVVCRRDGAKASSNGDNHLSYISSKDLCIIMTSVSPSMCIMQDLKTGSHSAYRVRRAGPHESEICLHRESMVNQLSSLAGRSGLSQNQSTFNLPHGPAANTSMPAFLNARTRKSLGLSHSKFPSPKSPLVYDMARHSSPLPTRGQATIPPRFTHNYYTPSPKRTDSLLEGQLGQPSPSRVATEGAQTSNAKPLYPQMCLQCVWSQPTSDVTGLPTEPSTAFLTTDLVGQGYLCLMSRGRNLLSLYRMKTTGDDKFLIFGEASLIRAKDGVSLESLCMLAVISPEGGVELYSGAVHVAKLLISGVPSCVATSSYLANSHTGPTFFKRSCTTSFPKRSSLLPQSVAHLSPVFNDSLSQLSPVTSMFDRVTPSLMSLPDISKEGSLVALRDAVGSRLSLEYSSGQLFRIEMPGFTSSALVKECLSSLCAVLSTQLSMQLSIRWYTTRNAPGSTDTTIEDEFLLFTDVLLGLVGYDLGLLKGNKHTVERSPVTRPKKQRTSELQSDDDWLFLLESRHHQLFSDSHQLQAVATPPPDHSTSPEATESTPEQVATPMDSSRTSSKFKPRSQSLDLIEETPVQSKTSLGKSRLPSNRFQMQLDRGGDISPMAGHSHAESDSNGSLISPTGLLYNHAPLILHTLHLLYEDMKLDDLKRTQLQSLVNLLYRIAVDLGLPLYVRHYWTDFPRTCPLRTDLRPSHHGNTCSTDPPPNIFQHMYDMLLQKALPPYPYQPGVNTRSKNLIQVVGLLSYGYADPSVNVDLLVRSRQESETTQSSKSHSRSHRPIPHRAIVLINKMGITHDTLQTLPPGVAFVLYDALYASRDNPGQGWSRETYKLAMRHDLASLRRQESKKEVGPTNELVMPSSTSGGAKNSTLRSGTELEEDGMEDLMNLDVLKLRFSSDQRVLEARRMLQSAQPVRVCIVQRPDVSDHEFIQEQEKHLYALCTRTMALSIGRGMITLRTAMPVLTEKLPIPNLCLTGREASTDKTVDMTHIEVVANMNVWPLFHNGVAAGLRLSHHAPDIDGNWILFNRPKTNNDELIEHAGLLMALGLNGHLKDLANKSIYHYLTKFHEMTSVGLILGTAAAKRGTMDIYLVRIVSVHVEAMLPPTGIELETDVVVAPASLIALGFLYQGTTHRHIAQVLLQEIGRPPGPEMENSVDRESYSLAAGLALGMVIFGKGDQLSELNDMAIPDTLHYYMVGGPKRPYLGSQHEKYKTPSFLIWEGDLVNTHVTGPGATLALGMFYFNTGNRAVSEWLKVPETQHLLEMVLPDALLLRTLARGLILWQDIEPSEEWVTSQVPAFVRPYCLVKPTSVVSEEDIDYETMNQAYCNIVAGACMAMGLRYAGSAHQQAFQTLLAFATKFTSLLGKSIAELCGKSTIETCLNVITVSLAMVMCGTGDLEVLRLCRYLRSRVGPANAVVTYGSHLATHMAIGLLFMGGGAYSLSTSPDAIAALLCAFYPKWPIHSNDNRYHLQALRHLYVLAVEPRLLLTRDIDTRMACYIHVTCVYLDTSPYSERTVTMRAPCLLSELSHLKEVRIQDTRYWSIVFKRDGNWSDLEIILSECSFVDVKQKAGCLSYLEDPQGFRTLLAQTLTSEEVIPWTVHVDSIFAFSSDAILVNLTQYFLERQSPSPDDGCPSTGTIEERILSWLTYVSYHCLTKDKLSLLPVWVSLLKHGQDLLLHPCSMAVWNLKLMWTQALRSSRCHVSSPLVPPDMALSVKQFLVNITEPWQPVVQPALKDLLLGRDLSAVDGDVQAKLIAYLILHDMHPAQLLHADKLLSVLQGKADLRKVMFSVDWPPSVLGVIRQLQSS